MKNNTFNILKKELREVFRDKKSLTMMLIVPIMIPLIIIMMSAFFDYQMDSDTNKYNKIGFTYDLSTEEIEINKSLDIDAVTGSEKDLKTKLENEEIGVYITKEENNYIINYDSNSDDSSSTLLVAESFLSTYKEQLQSEYLLDADIEYDKVMNIINVDYNEITDEDSNFFSNYIVNYAFLFIIMAITISSSVPLSFSPAV